MDKLFIIADELRQHSGIWLPIRRDRHSRIFALISKYRRNPPKAFASGCFEFRAKGCGYGTGETYLLARHMPRAIPIEPPSRSPLDS